MKKSKEFALMTKLWLSRLLRLVEMPALTSDRSMRTDESLFEAKLCEGTVAGVRDKVAKQPQSELREGWIQCANASANASA